MNTIFDYFKDRPIKTIYDLCNEFILYNLILSIEPNLKKVELVHDTDYKIKYENFSKIIESLSNYLIHNPERIYFTSKADFSSHLKIDSILKCEKDQAILLGEMLLFLSSISKNRESFEKLELCTTQSLSLYISIQEKYTTKFSGEDSKSIDYNVNGDEDDLDNGEHDNTHNNENDNIQASILCEKLKNEIKDKDKTILQLQSNYEELENKYNSCSQELSRLKDMNDTEYTAKEDLINQQILNDSLKNEIKELKLTKDNIINEYESKLKTINYKLNIANEKIVSLETENEKYKNYALENDRLKEKIKSLNSYKDTDKKLLECEQIINGKNDLIQDLTKEKNKIQDKNILLMKELSQLKQEINNKENKKITVENELRKIKNEFQELKISEKNLNRIIQNKKDNKGFELSEALLESGEINSQEDKEDYKQKYLEAIEEMETYKNIIMPLTEEKEKLEKENEAQKEVIEKLGGVDFLKKLNNNEEGEGINTNKEISALKQKISEQNNVSEELRKILDNKDKESDEYKKNLGEISEQLETYKNAVSLLTEEKGEYMNECQQLKEKIKYLENELSQNKNADSSTNINISTSNTIDNSKEINELKEKISERDGLIETLQGIISGDKDISILKTDGIDYKEKYNKLKEEKKEIEKKMIELKKDKDIYEKNNKIYEEKNKKLEEEIIDYKNNNLKLSDDNNRLNKEINDLKNKIINDGDNKVMQKKLDKLIAENERIKVSTIKEHELISSSMFELAIQLFSLKKEMEVKKNRENNNSGLSWVEIERRKNFPCEFYD